MIKKIAKNGLKILWMPWFSKIEFSRIKIEIIGARDSDPGLINHGVDIIEKKKLKNKTFKIFLSNNFKEIKLIPITKK